MPITKKPFGKLPGGEIQAVDNSPFDFRIPVVVASALSVGHEQIHLAKTIRKQRCMRLRASMGEVGQRKLIHNRGIVRWSHTV